MAGVLDALAADVTKMIKDMVKEEFCMLLGVAGHIKKLEANLVELRKLLTDAERRRINEEDVQAWVSKLKNTMYEATDVLDLCQLEAMERQEEHNSGGGGLEWCFLDVEGVLREKLQGCLVPFVGCLADILQPFLLCAQNPVFAHEVGTRIKKLNTELDSIRTGAAKYKFNKEEQGQRSISSASIPKSESKLFVRSDLVGYQIEKNTEMLVKEIIASSSCPVKVMAIVGMGGVGKSTLAKKVLASEKIGEDFKKIWLSVTQQFNNVELLRKAISKAGGEPDKSNDEETLREALANALSNKKFLLVLDDVWDHEVWISLLRDPVLVAGEIKPGSRVLITSRKRKVVQMMEASLIQEVYKLCDEDGWCLLKKQLPQPPTQPHTSNSSVGVQSDFDDLKDIGLKIVKKCDGLPLAIKIMGGLLRTKYRNKHEWELVLDKNLGWKDDESTDSLNYSLSLSYDDLDPKWKQCFLYYSLLPKGLGFTEDIVISMWISEGLVQHDGRPKHSLEEIGAEYHQELFARNLLERDAWEYTLHDVVRSFAEYIVKEEALVFQKDKADIGNLLLRSQKFRRISIFASKLDLAILENQEILRTLLIDCNFTPGGSLANFASLRVLDIRSEESDWLADSLCELRHLRYLSFSNTNISRLPGDIQKMRFLQHIQLKNCTKLDKLPMSITKLACLRYLNLVGSNIDVIPRGFGDLTNLRTLHGFPINTDGDWCSLEELEALSNLRSLTVQSLENVPGSSIAKRAKISNKKSLRYLELNCYKDYAEGQIGVEQRQIIKDVFDELCPPPSLETLMISRYVGSLLPIWLQSPAATTFENLKTVFLVQIPYCTRLPDGLCRMRSLEILMIEHAPSINRVGPDFQTLARGDGGVAFPSLTTLELSGMYEWKEWKWEEEQSKVISMPALERLSVAGCQLTHLPRGLASDRRYNLRTIILHSLLLLEYVENFPSVVELSVYNCPELNRISGLSKLQMAYINFCPKLKALNDLEFNAPVEVTFMATGADRLVKEVTWVTKGGDRFLKEVTSLSTGADRFLEEVTTPLNMLATRLLL